MHFPLTRRGFELLDYCALVRLDVGKKMKKWLVCVLAVFAWSCGEDTTPVAKPDPNPDNNNGESNNGETNNGMTTGNTGGTSGECVPSAGGVELCDGIDNDCDGQVDEDFPDLDEVCESGLGACAVEGVKVCAEDQLDTVCDAVAGEPSDEVCDEVDNDCDGEVDEDFEGLGDECSAGDGACSNTGTVVCQADGTAACNAVAGTPGGAELCNDMDDDCDGEIDEGFVGIGDACEVGVGACAASGVQVCAMDGSTVVCGAVEGTPADEICDGIDNDCDGDTDEGFNVGTSCAAGMGVCRQTGSIVCDGAGEAMCDAVAGNPPQNPELSCDNLDNDCDGTVDEGCDDDNDGYCDSGMQRVGNPTVCPTGGNDCNDTDASINPGAVEVCDGVDNDCANGVDQDATDASSYYLDCDGDDYAADTVASRDACMPPADSAAMTACNLSTASWTDRAPLDEDSTDCHSSNSNVRPNQTQYFAGAISNRPSGLETHDYNCDGVNTRRYSRTNVALSEPCPNGSRFTNPITGVSGPCMAPDPSFFPTDPIWKRNWSGWTGSSVPECGNSATFTTCDYGMVQNNVCVGVRVSRTETQTCR